jgi:tRNA-Thr(GGU) m(6)t(6)A37 methyltransferase TsaA
MEVEPIGVVRSPVSETVDEAWGSVVSEIHLLEGLEPGLTGIGDFSHILVLFLMHQATFDKARHLVRKQREREDMPLTGIFAQRARHRPNPIGVTAVRLLEVRDSVLRVQGLDAVDGTPVLDIKPYLPAFDRVENPTVPEWVDRLVEGYF